MDEIPAPTEWIETLRMVIGALEKAICSGTRAVMFVTFPDPGEPPRRVDPPPDDDVEVIDSANHPPPRE